MKKQRIKSKLWLVGLVLILTVGCQREEERKIKIAPRPPEAMMQEQVKTIQLAVEQKITVAVMSLDNRSEEPSADWLGEGIQYLLITNLDQSRQLNLSPSKYIKDVIENITSTERENQVLYQQVAAQIEAEYLVYGTYSVNGDSLRIDLNLLNVDPEQKRKSFSAVTLGRDMESISGIVSGLARQIRAELEDDFYAAPEIDRSLAEVTTNSIDAYQKYIEGVKKQDQFYQAEARELFKQAIEMDSTFASAYLKLAETMLNLRILDELREVMTKAMAFSQFTTERERLSIYAMNAMVHGEVYQAVNYYNRLVDLYPEDERSHYELGNYYFSVARNYKKAIEKYETTIRLDPKYKMAYNQLAYAYAYIGELDHSVHTLEKYVDLAPDEPNPYDSYAEILLREGRIDEAIDKFKTALRKNPQFLHSRIFLANAYEDLGKFNKARRLLKRALRDTLYEQQKSRILRELAKNSLMNGDKSKAVDYYTKAYEIDRHNPRHLISLLTLDPSSEEYQQQFVDLVKQLASEAEKEGTRLERLNGLIPHALKSNLAIEGIESILDVIIQEKRDPVLFQTAIAYKLVIDFLKGQSTKESEALFRNSIPPEAFQYAQPVSWNEYWRFYHAGLKRAYNLSVNIREWTRDFYQFAEKAGNRHFLVSSAIAMAGTEFVGGNQQKAEAIVTDMGIPCEGSWTMIGPFAVTKGFQQSFWPEESATEEWIASEQYSEQCFQKCDDLFDGYIDMKAIGNTHLNHAMYSVLQINSLTFKDVQLRLGSNGRLKVWLNDEAVMIKNINEAAIIDRYITDVHLKPGINWLLVRVYNVSGELGFYFRLTDTEGNGESGVTFNTPVSIAGYSESFCPGSS